MEAGTAGAEISNTFQPEYEWWNLGENSLQIALIRFLGEAGRSGDMGYKWD